MIGKENARRNSITHDQKEEIIRLFTTSNLTQIEIAERLGVGPYTVSRVLRGKKTRGIVNEQQAGQS